LPSESPATRKLDVDLETLKREGYYLPHAPRPSPGRRQSTKQKIADEVLITRLLGGLPVDGKKPLVTNYDLTPKEEKRARAALAQQLRNAGFELLALAIDPDTPSPVPGLRPTRKILIQALTQGPAQHSIRNQLIIGYITEHLQQQLRDNPKWPVPKLKTAISDAMPKFDLGRSTLMEIWEQSGRSEWFFPPKNRRGQKGGQSR
jgi:hypothetical protein